MSDLEHYMVRCGELARENRELRAELERLREIEKAALTVRDGFSFLNGKPGEEFGGAWIPFVEALARSRTSEEATTDE